MARSTATLRPTDIPPAAAEAVNDGAEHDIELLFWSAGLANVRRFHNQPYWEREGDLSDQATDIEGHVRLESVADHSWKVADAVLLLADRFPQLDRYRCLELAIVHDKLELLTGDYSPIDEDATGRTTHAFNKTVEAEKSAAERRALNEYLSRLRPRQRQYHKGLYDEIINISSAEARFVCALDKLAALLYIVQKKPNGLVAKHYHFTKAYSAKCLEYFPDLKHHYEALVARLKPASS